MFKGYQISFTVDEEQHVWKLAIPDEMEAMETIKREYFNANGFTIVPLKDEEIQTLQMTEGEIIRAL